MEHEGKRRDDYLRQVTKKFNIVVFFTHGVSLERWEQRGMFSREVQFYEALAEKLGMIHLFTYGRNDARYQERLKDRLVVHPKNLPLPNLLHGLVLPLLHWQTITHCNAIRIHQVAGAIPALLAHWILRKPLIVRAGFQWYSFANRQGASRPKLWLISLVERLAYRSATAIIHTTQEDADFVAQCYHVPRSKIHVIPNWVDAQMFRPMSVDKKPRSICFVGRLEKQKNLKMLITAMKGLDARLIVYGEGSLGTRLDEQARSLGVDVEFRGRIANEELPRELNACEIFILPSLYEGNPKVLLEAMTCGLPVIGTNVEGIKSVIQHNETGLLCEPTVESIREAIIRLLADHDLQARLGMRAREYILSTSSLDQAIQTELTLYPV
jgi:glycosyltransferase involved in cell wall biosynthesis